ncbi:hypothetical protein F4778DRAFT_786150 [Xylariomycetidae sp. FL2044]|nr:hypothetical protein F4778DRAFT_786150 [Xylariomycetidae sp. FL2044]
MSRSLLRSVLELRTPVTRLPPSYLLPIRARFLSTTTTRLQPVDPATAPSATPTQTTAPFMAPSKPATTTTTTTGPLPSRRTPPSQPVPLPAQGTPSESLAQLLPLLRAQPNHYVTAHIHGRPYLVQQGDRIRLPFKMPGVLPGDVLRLDRASVLGSRDYTVRGAPYIDDGIFECRATVLGTESEPMRVKIKTKRRNRKAKRVASKHKYTILRISELKVLEP